jgi:hypothetical protein
MAASFLSRLFSGLFAGEAESAPPPSPEDVKHLERLRQRPLPPEFAGPVPRVDVWGRQGYLAQPPYHERFKPLLIHGFATWGLVYQYEGEGDADGRDVVACYAWVDAYGKLRTCRIRESFDPTHALRGSGQGQMVLDVDANLKLGKELVIVQDPGGPDHLLYEALAISELSPPEAVPHWEPELEGELLLEWAKGRRFQAAQVRASEGRQLFTFERTERMGNDWSLQREGTVRLRAVCGQTLVPGASFHFRDAHGREVGGAVIRASGKISLATGQREFLINLGAERQNVVWEGEHLVLSTTAEALTSRREAWVLHEPLPREMVEVLVLGVVALSHAQRKTGAEPPAS